MRIKSTANVKTSDQKQEKWEDNLKWLDLKKTWTIRLVDGLIPVARHWVQILGSSKVFPIWCTKFNPETEEWDWEGKCPACEAGIRGQRIAISQVIVRELQQKGEDPIRAVQFPYSVINKVHEIAMEVNGGIPLEDPEQGMDIKIKYDPNASGTDRYMVFPLGKSPLTEEEKALKKYNLEKEVPDFFNNEAMIKENKDSLARAKYFLSKRRELLPGEENPWEAFVPNPNGEMYNTFPEVHLYLKGKWPKTGWNPSLLGGNNSTSSTSTPTPAPITSSQEGTEESPFKPTSEVAEKPDCYGSFKGDSNCISCPFMYECSAASV